MTAYQKIEKLRAIFSERGWQRKAVTEKDWVTVVRLLYRQQPIEIGTSLSEVQRKQAEAIITTIVRFFPEVSWQTMLARRGPEHIHWPRMIAMALVHQLVKPPPSLQAVAALFQRSDHGSVFHAQQRVAERLTIDPKFRTTLDQLRAHIRNGQ